MNNKNKILSLIAIVILCLGVSVFSFLYTPKLKDKIISQKESQINIDSFLSGNNSNEYINETAYTQISNKFTQEDDSLYSFRTNEGFEMVSYSEKWNEDKLVKLYEELLNNRHGKEIEMLYQVVVYDYADDYAAGTHLSFDHEITWILSHPMIPDFNLLFTENLGVISLYDGDKYTEVEDMAHTLSHEYGHHFTDYYIFNSEYYSYEDTEYEALRNFPEGKVKTNIWNYDAYMEEHQWYIMELAAEDYVQLMGSDTAKKIVNFVDVSQLLNGAKHPKIYFGYNARPQENMMIPLAYEIDGLYDYFNSFISDDYEPFVGLPEVKDINMQITKGTSHHESIDGPLNFTHYKITWNDPYTEKVTYTVLCFDEDDYYVLPIKTVKDNMSNIAYIGTVSKESATSINWYYDNIDSGTKTFMITGMFEDGSIIVLDSLEYVFK